MAELDQLDPPAAGRAGIQAALNKIRTNLAALKTSANSQWGSQITELDGAVEALKTTIALSTDRLMRNHLRRTEPGSTETCSHPVMSSQVSGPLLTAGCRTKKLHGSSGVTTP